MKVLVTGDTGFKGAWLCLWLQHRGDDVVGLALPPEDPRGVYTVACDHDHRDADVRDADAVRRVLADVKPQVVFHLAAQALVRRSYLDPRTTYETNVIGTVNVLEALPSSVDAALVVTSDKVYRHGDVHRPFVESDPLGGRDPYSASKACAEHVVAAWAASTQSAVATARAGNVIGGGDRAEDRLIPDVVRAIEAGAPTLVRNPTSTRPWQHVLDPLAGYLAHVDRLLEGDAPPALNFGPSGSARVDDVLDRFVGAIGVGSWQLDERVQPAEAAALALDASRARDSIGWVPRYDLSTSIQLTADWYATQLQGGDVRALTMQQIEAYR